MKSRANFQTQLSRPKSQALSPHRAASLWKASSFISYYILGASSAFSKSWFYWLSWLQCLERFFDEPFIQCQTFPFRSRAEELVLELAGILQASSLAWTQEMEALCTSWVWLSGEQVEKNAHTKFLIYKVFLRAGERNWNWDLKCCHSACVKKKSYL